MEVSKIQDGQSLIDSVVDLTGLPKELVQTELTGIISNNGYDPAKLTLDDLREVMLAYLESIQSDIDSTDSDIKNN